MENGIEFLIAKAVDENGDFESRIFIQTEMERETKISKSPSYFMEPIK